MSLKQIEGSIVGFFKNLGSKLKPEAEAALVAFEQKLTPDAVDLMVDAVELVASSNLTDVAAREAAITQFIAQAKTTAVDAAAFAKNELNALVEIAVIAIKKKGATVSQ